MVRTASTERQLTIYAIVPVSAGSERVVGKNLTMIGSTPLLQRAVLVCREAGLEPVVLTESPEYASIARLLRCRVIPQPANLPARQHTLDEVLAAAVAEHPWLAEDDLLMVQATVICGPDHLRALVNAKPRKPTALAAPNRHIIWTAQGAVTPRVKGEDTRTWREVGVRYYPKGWYSPPQQIHPVDDDLVDIDYPADVLVAQPRKRILFRVRASEKVGSGHLRRCLAIAQELQHHKIGFTFTGSSSDALGLVPAKWLAELAWPDVIVNDTLDTVRGEVSRWGVPWIALEDEGEDAPLAEFQVNALYGTGLSGGRWADIRPEFYAVPGWNPHAGILVTFGGTDPARLTEWFLTTSVAARVMVPPGRPIDSDDPRLVRDSSMAEEIARAKLVICSGGRTVMEALFCRRPVLVVAQNPRELRHTHLRPECGVLNMGLAGAGGERRLVDTLAELTGEGLASLYDATENQVDGGGIRRIAGLVEGMLR